MTTFWLITLTFGKRITYRINNNETEKWSLLIIHNNSAYSVVSDYLQCGPKSWLGPIFSAPEWPKNDIQVSFEQKYNFAPSHLFGLHSARKLQTVIYFNKAGLFFAQFLGGNLRQVASISLSFPQNLEFFVKSLSFFVKSLSLFSRSLVYSRNRSPMAPIGPDLLYRGYYVLSYYYWPATITR